MKIKCKETFEQGQSKAEGGMFKMIKDQVYEGTSSEHGVVVTLAGRQRTISPTILVNLRKADLIEIE
jgi:hypothetical protein